MRKSIPITHQYHLKERAVRLIEKLKSTYEEVQDPSILRGKAGIALCLFIAGEVLNDTECNTIANELVESVFTDVNDGFTHHSYASGLAGISTCFSYLNKKGFLDNEVDEEFGNLAQFFINAQQQELGNNNPDILHGAGGLIPFFLRFKHLPQSMPGIDNYLTYVEKTSLQNGTSLYLEFDNSDEEIGSWVDLGLAHGLAGQIWLIHQIYNAGIYQNRCKTLLEGFVNFYNENLQSGMNSCFSSGILSENHSPNTSRLAWCYGDLGILAVLDQVPFGEFDHLTKPLVSQLKESVKSRVDFENNGVVDPFLCHGTGGLALIYLNLAKRSNDTGFYNLAQSALEHMISSDKKDHQSLGLLEGSTGTLLSVLSFINPDYLDWTKILFLQNL